MTIALAIAVAGAIGVPHLLPLHRARPSRAVAAWIAVIVLRAATATSLAVFAVLALPRTESFEFLARFCVHTIVPLVEIDLGLHGDDVGAAAVLLPTLILAASVASALWAVRRAARAVRELIRRDAIAGGPGGSLIVGGQPVVVAAAGLRRPRVVVSAGALMVLDDAELAASLAHERGHIERRHRFILFAAEMFAALARFVPGTRAAVRELAFHLERDADDYAIRRRHDPAVLATAICKAADVGEPTPALTRLGGSHATERVTTLVGKPGATQRAGRAGGAMAVAIAATALALALLVPAAAFGGVSGAGAAAPARHCPH